VTSAKHFSIKGTLRNAMPWKGKRQNVGSESKLRSMTIWKP
jgi:hypothetical protein